MNTYFSAKGGTRTFCLEEPNSRKGSRRLGTENFQPRANSIEKCEQISLHLGSVLKNADDFFFFGGGGRDMASSFHHHQAPPLVV